jgi:tRNA U34 5-carboxymethylaminomethyl modifying GTPase MnmE/TrmE
MTVVIAGRPNAGKSSLLNRLAGYDAAIVTPHPGTTRDVLREHIDIDGMPLHVLDTAGLRAALDVAEEEGIRRAEAEMLRADRVLFVIDALEDPDGQCLSGRTAATAARCGGDAGVQQMRSCGRRAGRRHRLRPAAHHALGLSGEGIDRSCVRT